MGGVNDELRGLGDRMDNRQIGATRGFWNLCRAQEKAENPTAGKRVLTALTGRRFTRLMFGVLLQDLTRAPGEFTEQVAALANGVVREVGECLAVFPFKERVAAFNGLADQLSAGLGIKVEPPGPDLSLLAAMVDAAGGEVTISRDHMERANQGELVSVGSPIDGSITYRRVFAAAPATEG